MKLFIHDAFVQKVWKKNTTREDKFPLKKENTIQEDFFEGITNIVNKQSDSSEM